LTRKRGLVQAEVAALPEATFLELHLLFPNSLVVSQNKKQPFRRRSRPRSWTQEKALAKEASQAKQARHSGSMKRIGLAPFCLGPAPLSAGLYQDQPVGQPGQGSRKELGHNFEIARLQPDHGPDPGHQERRRTARPCPRKSPSGPAGAKLTIKAGTGRERTSLMRQDQQVQGRPAAFKQDLQKGRQWQELYQQQELTKYGDSKGITSSYKQWQEDSQEALIKEGYVDKQLQERADKADLLRVRDHVCQRCCRAGLLLLV
jgi:hypothetical protein